VTAEERHCQRHLTIAEADERAMAAWREIFPQDFIDERKFYAQKQAEREATNQARKATMRSWSWMIGAPSII
jgi:hypothetical protein